MPLRYTLNYRFFQVYRDSNRQGIHDKIASTVLVNLREKKKNKFEDLSKKVLKSENLLDEDEPGDDET